MVNNESESNEKENQLVTFRCPRELLAKLDAKGKGDRAEKLRVIIAKWTKIPGEPQTEGENAIYETAKKELRDSFAVSDRMFKSISGMTFDYMLRKACDVLKIAFKDRTLEALVAKMRDNHRETVRELGSFTPVVVNIRGSFSPTEWELFIEFLEELAKQVDLKKKVDELR